MKKPATDPVVAGDILDTSVQQLLQAAITNGTAYQDSPDRRAVLAQAAQDHLIALRLLGVKFAPQPGVAVVLEEAGDLYVFGKPCHPRDAAEKIAAGFQVPDLIDLNDKLSDALEYEAEPVTGIPMGGPVASSAPSSSSSSSPASSPAPVAAAPAPAAGIDLGALAAQIVAALRSPPADPAAPSPAK